MFFLSFGTSDNRDCVQSASVERLGTPRESTGLDHTKFEDMQQALSRKAVFDKLAREFQLIFDFKVACTKLPDLSYTNNMELRVLAHEMVVAYFPNSKHWRSIQHYGSTKFKLQP